MPTNENSEEQEFLENQDWGVPPSELYLGVQELVEERSQRIGPLSLADLAPFSLARYTGFQILTPEGGQADIYRAFDRILAHEVAIKIPKNDTSRFLNELLISAKLRHPSIVPVLEAGRFTETGDELGLIFPSKYGMVMELIKGENLSKKIKEAGTLTDRCALLPHLITVVEATQYAHSQGIVHRDIKPANILVGEQNRTVLIDWGIAKDLKSSRGESASTTPNPKKLGTVLTEVGSILGTPGYSPPEQEKDSSSVDGSADVYALGATLYHILTGTPPKASSLLLRQTTSETTAQPSPTIESQLKEVAAQEEYPRELVAIVAKATKQKPAQRYKTEKLLDDLRRYQNEEEVSSYPYSRVERLGRFYKKNRAPVLLGSALLLSLFLGVGIYLFVAIQLAEQKRIQSESARAEAERRVKLRLKGEEQSGTSFLAAGDFERALAFFSDAYSGYANSSLSAPASLRLLLSLTSKSLNSKQFLDTGGEPVVYADFSPNQGQLVVLGQKGGVFLSEDGKTLTKLDASPRGTLRYASFSPNGKQLAVLADEVALWDAISWRTLPIKKEDIRAIRWSPDSELLLTLSDQNGLQLWSSRDASLHASYAPPTPSTPITTAEFLLSQDALRLVFAIDQNLFLWEPGTAPVLFSTQALPYAVPSGPIRVIRTSTNGELLVALSQNPSATKANKHTIATLWNTKMRTPLFARVSHYGEICDAAFDAGQFDNPRTEDVFDPGLRLVTANKHSGLSGGERVESGGSVEIWNQAPGTHLGDPAELYALEGHTGDVCHLAITPKGDRIITTSSDGRLWLWHIGVREQALLYSAKGHEGDILSLRLSSDGAQALTVGEDGRAILWRLQDSRLHRLFEGHQSEPCGQLPLPNRWITDTSFSPSGTLIGAPGYDGLIALIPTTPGQEVRWLKDHCLEQSALPEQARRESVILSAEFSPDGALLLSASEDGTARLWDVQHGRCLLTLEHGPGKVHLAKWSPDGRFFVSASEDGIARVWDVDQLLTMAPKDTAHCPRLSLQESTSAFVALKGHKGEVFYAEFSPSNDFVATAGYDGKAIVWDAASGQKLAQFQIPHSSSAGNYRVSHVRFHPVDEFLALSGTDSVVRLWNWKQNSENNLTDKLLVGHTQRVDSVQFSPNGNLLVTASADGSAKVWDVLTGALLFNLQGHEAADIGADVHDRSVAFSPDGELIATAGSDNTIKLYGVETGELLFTFQQHEKTDVIRAVRFSQDGSLLASTGNDGVVRIWETDLENKTPQEVMDLVRREVPFRLQGGQLLSIE